MTDSPAQSPAQSQPHDLEVSRVVAASPEQVYALVSDLPHEKRNSRRTYARRSTGGDGGDAAAGAGLPRAAAGPAASANGARVAAQRRLADLEALLRRFRGRETVFGRAALKRKSPAKMPGFAGIDWQNRSALDARGTALGERFHLLDGRHCCVTGERRQERAVRPSQSQCLFVRAAAQ